MKVWELIEALTRFNPQLQVFLEDVNDGQQEIEVTEVVQLPRHQWTNSVTPERVVLL